MEGWSSGNGHGLSLIYEKMTACYGDNFDMKIEVPKKKGTLVSVMIPAVSGDNIRGI